jgi:hypothetical protein
MSADAHARPSGTAPQPLSDVNIPTPTHAERADRDAEGRQEKGSITRMIGAVVAAIILVTISVVLAAPDANIAMYLHQNVRPPGCQPSGDIVRLKGLPEASGVVASRRAPGVLWAHNDSGEPLVFALNEQGAVTGRVSVTGAKVEDWEDIAVGPCPPGSCIYIADVGDNSGSRDHITVYRVPEPLPQDSSTGPAEVFRARYPGGAYDAEALFVTPKAEVFIITKGDPGPVALYRFPRVLRSDAIMQLERVGAPAATAKVSAQERPTAADVSQDAQWVAVRTTHRVVFYRTADLISGRWREAFRTDVSSLREPRGEGIAFGAGGTIFLVGEGGGFSSPGTFARLACTMNP